MCSTPYSGSFSAGVSMPSYPLVSVIIPYYKQEAFLAETVRSAQQQTYPNFEIIVVDDGSPVPASSVLPKSSDVRVLRTENRGRSAARNLGFQTSLGEYIVFLDSDDRLLPGAIEAHIKALAEHPKAVLSFGAQRIIDEYGHEVRPPHICRPRKDYFLMLLEGNPIGCPGATMIRRHAFVQAGPFDEFFCPTEDYHLYLRLARNHPFVQHGFCVVEYRLHSNSSSQDKEAVLAGVMATLNSMENTLTPHERRRARYGRGRWAHGCRPNKTLAYRLHGLYYSFRAMLGVPLRSHFSSQDSEGTRASLGL
jgi:glycosyltransferase involved in cell wall biosynthesis